MGVPALQEGYRIQEVSVPLRAVEAHAAALVLAETPEDILDRTRAARLVRSAETAGVLALRTELDEIPLTEEQEMRSAYPTLMHAIRAAATGDPMARKFVETNARTAAIEITLKTGHVTETSIYADAQGKLFQYGQAMEDVLTNGLIFASDAPEIRNRTIPEIRNGVRMERATRQGQLKDNFLVVISRYIDGISDEDAQRFGLFPDTKSASIQVTTEVSEGELVQQSAFVAGVRQPDGERHDRQTVARLGRKLGINLDGLNDAETIDRAFLIPKHLMPDGVIDIVRWYDEAAGGTFFGEDKPVRDYLAYREFCRARETALEPAVREAVQELLAEAGSIVTPQMAAERLHKIVDAKMIRRAVFEDRTVDLRVFGAKAINLIEQGRQRYDSGDVQGAEEAVEQAAEASTSATCPSALRKAAANDRSDGESGPTSSENESSELCIITTKNCYCCDYNFDGTKRATKLTVKAYHDAQETLRCMRFGCGAWISKGGQKNIGAIAGRAEQLRVERERMQAVPVQKAA